MERREKLRVRTAVLSFVLGISILALPILAEATRAGETGDTSQPSQALPSMPQRRALSLRVLMERTRSALSQGKLPEKEVLLLAGLSRIDMYVTIPSANDIALVGHVDPLREGLSIDDLMVALRNAWRSSQYPFCSLDPKNENIVKLRPVLSQEVNLSERASVERYAKQIEQTLGPQVVRIGGVSRDSLWAGTMIKADYHMKAVSQGHVQIKGITSTLDRHLSAWEKAVQKDDYTPQASGLNISRFWFHIAAGDPQYAKAEGIVRLQSCRVVLLTERQRDAVDGTLRDDKGNRDPVTSAFAEEFSKNFAAAAEAHPVYGRLEDMYALLALSHRMKLENVPDEVGLDIRFLLDVCPLLQPIDLKPEVDCLVNWKLRTFEKRDGRVITRYTMAPLVAGGVSMQLGDLRRTLAAKTRSLETLFKVRKAVLAARPREDRLWWDLPSQ